MIERKFDQGIYAIAWGGFRKNYAAFAGLALTIAFLDSLLLAIGRDGFGISLFMTIMLNLAAHHILLHDPKDAQEVIPAPIKGMPIFRFCWWSFLLMLPPSVIAAILIVGGGGSPGAVVFGAVVAIAIFAVTLGLFGTILPEIVLGERADLVAAFARGKRVLWPTIGRLAIGPGAFWILLVLGQVVLALLGAPSDAYDPETGQVSWIGGVVAILVMIGVIFASILAAAVLCKAYYQGQAVSR